MANHALRRPAWRRGLQSMRPVAAVAELLSLATSHMSCMFEIYYPGPEDAAREARLTSDAVAGGGRLDFREAAGVDGSSICLTFEFESRAQAEAVAETLRRQGGHVEGVYDYT